MKTKLGASLIAALMMMGMFGAASANAVPDPEGPAQKGLCTAYFNGQKVGHDKHGDPGPFQALEDVAANQDGEGNDDGQDSYDDSAAGGQDLEQAAAVFEFCDGLIGGNSEHGRYSCATDAEDNTTCTRNEKPGNGPAKG